MPAEFLEGMRYADKKQPELPLPRSSRYRGEITQPLTETGNTDLPGLAKGISSLEYLY